MRYKIIQPPFADFDALSKKELREYNDWFHEVLPKRIEGLEKAVRATRGYERWKADFTPDSLKALSNWFEKHAEARRMSNVEKKEMTRNLLFPVEISDLMPTDQTLSLAMDIGMYFGQVVIKNIGGTAWDQKTGSKRNVDYGYPVITGFGLAVLNPTSIITTLALRVLEDGEPADIHKTYSVWASMAAPTPTKRKGAR